jgi:hypothetical protein
MKADANLGLLTPDALREALRAGDPQALERLRVAVAARRQQRGGHTEWGQFCEEAGEGGLALSEYQLALRDDPDDLVALSRLSLLYEEHGDLDRAIECAERWARLAPADEEAARIVVDLLAAGGLFERGRELLETSVAAGLREEVVQGLRARIDAAARLEGSGEAAEEELPPGTPTDADAVRFAHLFAGRENVYARQWAGPGGEGGYSPVHEPFTAQVARNHLLGSITVGVYPVRLDNTVTFFAFDIDINKRVLARARGSVAEARRLKDLVSREARDLQAELLAFGVPALLEDSGYKGRHLWVFLAAPEDAGVVRTFGGLFLAACPVVSRELHVEFFPKQASVAGGIGNLIKLPLGIHRRTGRRSRLLRPDGSAEPDPYGALRRQPRLERRALHAAIALLKSRATVRPAADLKAAEEEDKPTPEGTLIDVSAFPAPPPSWTSADFETNAEIAQILAHCPVLAALKEKVERHRRLTHEEQVVLKHSLGHSGVGVLAVNYLLDACVDTPPTDRLQTPLSGNPISCPKIRKRIPHITGSVACNCLFDFAPGQYPTPRLHLLRPGPVRSVEAPAKAAPSWDPVDRTRALRVLRVRLLEIQTEISRLESELIEYMERAAVAEIDTVDGVLRLVQEEGAIPALAWEPRPALRPGDSEEAPAAATG